MSLSKERFGPALSCVVAAALFGASAPLAKELIARSGPLTIAGLLYLGAALGVAPFALRGGAPARRRQPRHLAYLGCAVLFGGILGPALLMFGLVRVPAASAALWLNLETVATAVLAWAFFREHLGARVVLALGCILGAGVWMAAPFETGNTVGAALIGSACLCWGLDNNVTALIDGFTPSQVTLIKGVVAGSFTLLLGVVLEAPAAAPVIAGALVVGSLSYGVSIVLYVRGAHALGATRSQLVFSSAPLWGVAVAWVAVGEPVLSAQLVAIVPMAVGVALLLSASHSHRHSHEPMTHTHAHRHDDGHHSHRHSELPVGTVHTHEHAHEAQSHEHAHHPDLHHRHEHG